jgi:hypothetical protein
MRNVARIIDVGEPGRDPSVDRQLRQRGRVRAKPRAGRLQRIILPDGSSIRIDNVPAADTQGYAGLSDSIDRHTWQLLKGVGLSSYSASAPS